MLPEEAKWLGQKIYQLDPSTVFPMLDIGSSTEKFRKYKQPWIDEHIFKPARDMGLEVKHQDVKDATGVDIVGDLSDKNFMDIMRGMKVNSIFCSNLLEHLNDRSEIASSLASIIPEGGYLFVSCPYRYHYHADPIDTMYRPNLSELASEFPGMSIIDGAIVVCNSPIRRSYSKLTTKLVRTILPFYMPFKFFARIRQIPWLFKDYEVSCLVMRKEVI